MKRPATHLHRGGEGHPYRLLPVIQGAVTVESAHCGWCRFRDMSDCAHPVNAGASPHYWWKMNPRGECPHHEPSWWTRVLRALHLGRAPAMVDPRVWDEPAPGSE